MKTPTTSIALVLFASLISSLGAVFLKLGAEKLRYGLRHVISLQAAAGVALFLLSSVFFGWGIKNGQLSVLYPMASLGYVWSLLWGKLFFKERVNSSKFAALGMILFGVVLIASAA